MSGHSKWSSIKHQKGAADAKRGAIFSKLAKAISVAARHGVDPEVNFQLRIAIDQARSNNMPKDNIERAIERAAGVGGAALEEITSEAYGPGGTAFLIETATDNRNRTIGEIRSVLNKYDGKLAETGGVAYLFKRRGQITVETSDANAVELAAIEAGAEDFETDEGKVYIYTQPKELEAVRQKLSSAGYTDSQAGFEYHPTASVPITDPKLAEKVVKLAGALEDLDDVTAIHSNFAVADNLLE